MRVGVTVEHLFARVPGGIGRYIRGLMSALPTVARAEGGAVTWVRAGHARPRVASAGLERSDVVALGLPGRVVNRTWVAVRRPALSRRFLAGIDVLHATTAAIPPVRGVPLVVTVHDVAFRRFPEAYPPGGRRFHERSARIAATEAARILVPSRATADDLVELYGIERDRLVVTPLGVDLPPPDREATSRLLESLGVSGPFLLASGTLEPRKNLPRLIRAFESCAAAFPAHHLVIAGPAGWGPALARPPGIASRVHLTGPLGDRPLQGLYASADAFAYLSLYEGFGLPVIEAMAHGLPVLTGNRSALPEVAGEAALLVNPTDDEEIAAAVTVLLGDPEVRRRLSEAGPRRAAMFTWEATARATWDAYRQALG